MRKADEQDLRDALSEEVESLEPSDELWNNIYKRSVVKQERKRNPWLKSALAMGAAAAAAAVFLLSGQMQPGRGPEPAPGPGPVTLVQPLVKPFAAPGETPLNPEADRPYVRYNHTMYWHNGESIPAGNLGALLATTTTESSFGAGREIRAIQGADPVRKIAVQTDKGWYAMENMLKPLESPNP